MNRNLIIATHTIAVATFVLVLVVIAPRRGLHLAGDEGFFLVSALAAVQGQGAEIIISQSAHYLLNTILIGAGITEV